MKIKRVPTDEVIIEVEPRSAGNFGLLRMSGQHREPDEEYRFAQEIERNIKRHIDDVEYTSIVQQRMYVDENDNEYETLYELLEDNLEYDFRYRVEYKRPSDNGVGTVSTLHSFQEVIEEAFKNPYEFRVIKGILNDEQRLFLNKVIDLGIESTVEWV